MSQNGKNDKSRLHIEEAQVPYEGQTSVLNVFNMYTPGGGHLAATGAIPSPYPGFIVTHAPRQ